jgi:hypothetical protein
MMVFAGELSIFPVEGTWSIKYLLRQYDVSRSTIIRLWSEYQWNHWSIARWDEWDEHKGWKGKNLEWRDYLISLATTCWFYLQIYQEVEAVVVNGNGMEVGHTIVTTVGGTVGGRNSQSRQVLEKAQPWQSLNICLVPSATSCGNGCTTYTMNNNKNWYYVPQPLIVPFWVPLKEPSRFITNESFIKLQTISYMAERIVGQGSFGVVFQVCCWTQRFCFSCSMP